MLACGGLDLTTNCLQAFVEEYQAGHALWSLKFQHRRHGDRVNCDTSPSPSARGPPDINMMARYAGSSWSGKKYS